MPQWIVSIVRFFQNCFVNDDTLDTMQAIMDS